MIDLTIHSETLENNIDYCRAKNINQPTITMMKNPAEIPQVKKEQLRTTRLRDLQ